MPAAPQPIPDVEGFVRSLLRNVPGAVYRCDVDAAFTMRLLGDQIERVTGYPAEEIARRRLAEDARLRSDAATARAAELEPRERGSSPPPTTPGGVSSATSAAAPSSASSPRRSRCASRSAT